MWHRGVFFRWNIYICFENRLILNSPKKYISASFLLVFEKCEVIVPLKLPLLGGEEIVPTTTGFESDKKISAVYTAENH